jgi:hypothetical protein
MLCFPAAYGNINHVAMATAWREPKSGELRLAVMHQESIPDGGKPTFFTGRVYDTFDTSADYPGGISPAVESMRLAGLPRVNVFPSLLPQDLPGVTLALRGGLGDHPYGPNEKWAQVPAELKGKQFATCFTITEMGVNATSGQVLKVSGEPTFPNIMLTLAPLVSTDVSKWNAIQLQDRTVSLEQFGELEPKEAGQVFRKVGSTWGDMPWDVQSLYTVKSKTEELSAGRFPVADDPNVHAVKFISPPRGIELDGVPVQAGVTYMAPDVRRMTVSAEPDAKVKVSYSISTAPASLPHSNL